MKKKSPREAANAFDFLAGGGELAGRIRSFDWSATPLGLIERWPQSLKTSISLMLNSRHPMWIGWGPEATFLYNDAYVQVLSLAKHPWALGRPAEQVWAEIWDVCGPLAEKVFQKGEASFVDDMQLFMSRGNFLEETFYSFSYSPIRDESGHVGGLFCPSAEVTAKILNARRLRTLSELAARSLMEKSTEAACASAAAILAKNRDDIPFALLYLLDGEGKSARLEQAAGIPQEHQIIKLGPGLWPIAEVFSGARSQVVSLSGIDGLPSGAAGRRVSEAVALPLAAGGQERPAGVLIAGVNPTRKLDAEYRAFYELVAGHVATFIWNARAAEAEKRRADTLAELDRAKTAFFSNVSHEFRTPLTLMLGPMEDLLRKPEAELPRENRALAEVAHRNGVRLLKLVNTLLDFSRIEAVGTRAAFAETDLAAETAGLASVFRSAMERGGLKFTVDCPPLPQSVFVDRDMWEKIVFNLLSNAFKFTLGGEVRVSLRTVRQQAVLSVRDTGVGIAAADLPDIFKRFHRVENARGRTHEGSGIGLALVQELVKLHGGTLEAESEPGRGSTFSVRIPLGKEHLPEGRIEAQPREVSSAKHGAAFVEEALSWLSEKGAPASNETPATAFPRILVAEDNADMRDYVNRVLRSRYAVETAPDGAAALEAARKNPPDLILSDVMMPGMNGFALLRQLRADERLKSTPIILLSARAGEEALVEGVSRGADDYLIKPFSAPELLARIASRLELTRLRQAAAAAVENERTRLYDLLMNAPAMICALRGPQHVFEMANPGYLRIVGRSDAREILGKTVRQALPEIEGQGYFEILDRVYATGEPFVGNELKVKMERAPGHLEEVFVNFVYQPTRGIAGDVDGILVHAVEVTGQVHARRQVEDLAARLGEERDRLRGIVDQTTAGIAQTDLTGRFVLVNERYCAIAGYSREELSQRRMRDIIHPEDLASGLPLFKRVAAEGTAFLVEQRYLRKDGSPVWVENAVSAVRDASGKPSYLVAVALDITERKRTERALVESEGRLRTLIASSPAAILVIDPNAAVRLWNAAAEKLFGWTEAEVLGKPVPFLPEGKRPECVSCRDTALRGEVFAIETERLRRDGSLVEVSLSAAPLRDPRGEIAEILVLIEDITERKRAEALVLCQKRAFEMVASGAPLPEVLEFLARAAESHWSSGAAVAVRLLNESATGFERTAAPNLPPEYREATEGVEVASGIDPCCAAVASRRRVPVSDFAASGQFPEFASFAATLGIRSGWSTPIIASTGKTLGTIANYYREPREPNPQDDLSGEFVTRTAAIVIERKRAEDAALRRTAQFQTLLNEAPLGVYVVDADFRVGETNPTALAAFGNIPNLIGRDFGDVMHILWPKPYADEIVRRFRHTFETGEPFSVPERVERRLDSGAREYYEWRINRIPLPEGRYGVVCYFRDISRQVLTREAIAQSEERLRFMAESMPQKIFTAKATGEVDYFNRQWMTFTGLTFEQIENWGWTQFVHPGDVDETVRVWRQAVSTGEPFQCIHRFRRFDGAYRWHLSRAQAMRGDDGAISMWIGSNTEIHEQKRTEEELRRVNGDLNQFAYAAAHDLREPLRNVANYTDLLVRTYQERFDGNADRFKRYIVDGVARMDMLLSDLLAYTHAGNTEAMSPVDGNAALQNALRNLDAKIREREAAITCDPLPRLFGQEGHYVQLFQNLIGNAIKYSGDQTPRVHVGVKEHNGDWLFSVKDNGMGIEPEHFERIFGLFKRLHGKNIPGTGIGLAICSKVVERYGGRIWVESQPGNGAEFFFTLPIDGGGGEVSLRGNNG